MNLQYFKETNQLNRRQARWAEVLQEYNFKIVYRKGSANGKVDALSRCPEFISREGGTESTERKGLLGPELWINMGSMDIEDEEIEEIVLAGFSINKLTSKVMECWTTEIGKDNKYQEIIKKVKNKEKNVDERLELDLDGMLV